jgi:hypothetical protein
MKNSEIDAKKSLESGDILKASFLYKDALKDNIGKPNSKNETKRLKKELININKKIIDPKNKVFEEINISTDVSREKAILDQFIEKLMCEEIDFILKIIGTHKDFTINYKSILESSKKSIPLSQRLASTATYSTEGHIIPGSTSGEYSWTVQMYEMNLQLTSKLLLMPLFENLISSKKLNPKELIKYFKKSHLIQYENLPFVRHGINSFFKKDYISFLHIMIPQFENVFLKISSDLGIDIITVEKSIETKTRTLSSQNLLSKDFAEVWGENYCRRIDHILFESLGLKLRHKIAHGEILKEECTFENSLHILYLYLVLLAVIKKIPN